MPRHVCGTHRLSRCDNSCNETACGRASVGLVFSLAPGNNIVGLVLVAPIICSVSAGSDPVCKMRHTQSRAAGDADVRPRLTAARPPLARRTTTAAWLRGRALPRRHHRRPLPRARNWLIHTGGLRRAARAARRAALRRGGWPRALCRDRRVPAAPVQGRAEHGAARGDEAPRRR